jgi:competence protein ComEA
MQTGHSAAGASVNAAQRSRGPSNRAFGARGIARLLIALALAVALPGAAVAPVDANVATTEQLRTIKGIGPAMAERIVQERRKGPFKDLADFRARVKGVGDQRARRLAAAGLRFGPASTAPDPRPAAPIPRSAAPLAPAAAARYRAN